MEILNQIQQGLEQGLITQEDMESLYKALTAGYGYAGKPTDLTYGGVIQAESLETTLKSVTFDMKTLKFWPEVNVDKAYNLFEQYNRLISYGSDSAPYMGEGGAPQEEDSTYVRDGQRIAFFGTRRKVSHQMTLVRTTVGDVVAQQAKEGTMHLLKNVEREMYWGNAHYINAINGSYTGSPSDIPTNSISMNGLLEQLMKGDSDVQMRSGDFEGYGPFNSILSDLNAATITQDDIERMSVVCLENFGKPDQLHIEPIALSVFVRSFYPQFRSEPGLTQTVGYNTKTMMTTAGEVAFKPNLFLRPRANVRLNGVNAMAPAAPTVAGAVSAVAGRLVPGVYQYSVTCVNDAGEGAPGNAAVTVLAGASAAQLNLTVVPSGTKTVRVYRSAVGGVAGTEKFVGNYKYTGASMSVVDAGAKLPGLGEAYLLDMTAENLRFKQLAPLSKINFAIVSTALEFAIVLYGALFVYTPRFNGVFFNLGK